MLRTEPPLPPGAENNSAAALARKVSFLSRSDSYTPAPPEVRSRETHMSWVFMNGERVYKLKKPVRFPYLDFSTLERRAAACRAEAELNRRLAPDVYIGVVPLTEAKGSLAIDGTGRVVDWLVVMHKLNEEGTLEAALEDHRVRPAEAERLATTLSRFYSHARRILINPESYVASLRQAAVMDWRVLLDRRFGLPYGTIARVASLQRQFLRGHAEDLIDRVRQRHIVDAHGDLRPEHIWLSAPFAIIDCLEFNSRLRALDALDELAFLHLECERLGEPWVGDAIRRRLAGQLGDDPRSGVFLFYRIGRAMLRARLSIAHLLDPHPRTPEKWPRQARTYLALAEADATRLARLL